MIDQLTMVGVSG